MSLLDYTFAELGIIGQSAIRQNGMWKCSVHTHAVTGVGEAPTLSQALAAALAQLRK